MEKVEQLNPYIDDKRHKKEQVEAMFDSIAPAYDFMNRAMTAGMDRLWLRSLLRRARAAAPADVADFATGTGDVALALKRALPQACVSGLDLSEGMLAKARAKAERAGADISFEQTDCTATGYADNSFDLVTIAYGIRNFADIEAGYREMLRILRPGGQLLVLELTEPATALVKPFYRFYTRCVIPAAGSMVAGDRSAYTYLPQSIAACPQRAAMTAIMSKAGFADASYKSLFPGVCTLYTAIKPRL